MGASQVMLLTVPNYQRGIVFPKGQNKIEYFKLLTESYWKESQININELTNEIDDYIARAKYWKSTFPQWKFNDGIIDNDATIYAVDYNIQYFYFRSDMYEPEHTFLKNMLSLCKRYRLFVYGLNGRSSNPIYEEVIAKIANSSFYKF